MSALICAILLSVVGCGVVEKRTGIVTTHVTASNRESRVAPAAGCMVEVYVNGGFVGTYQTNPSGELTVNYGAYVPAALRSNTGIRMEFRFRQQDGTVHSKKLDFTPEQLRSANR